MVRYPIVLSLLLTGLFGHGIIEAHPGDIDAKELRRELRAASQLLKAGHIKEGTQRLEAILVKDPKSKSTSKIRRFLRDYGVGREVRALLQDRKVLSERFKFNEKKLLEMTEAVLRDLRKSYKGLEVFYENHRLEVLLHDSEAAYRKAGGDVTTGGHFLTSESQLSSSSTRGKIEWYYPVKMGNPNDRMTRMKSLLYHESSHYFNSLYFAGYLPGVLNEGIAVWLTGELNDTYYQAFRTKDRLRTESDARKGLGMIAKYADFLKFLAAERALGRGDDSVSRWYGLCYSIIDTFDRAKISGKRASSSKLFEALSRRALEKSKGADGKPKRKQPRSPGARELLESLVAEFYGVNLEAFHKHLVKTVLKYRSI